MMVYSPLHRFAFSRLDIRNTSGLFTFQNCTWVVTGYVDEVHLTRISANGNNESGDEEVFKTVFLPPNEIGITWWTFMSPAFGILVYKKGSVDMFKYFWDSKMNCTSVKERRVHVPELSVKTISDGPAKILGVDESKGRITLLKDKAVVTVDLMATL